MFLDMPAENVHSIDGHWTVDVNRKDRNLMFQFQLAEDVKQLLSSAYRKRRDQNCFVLFGRSIDDIAQLFLTVLVVFVRMQAITICGFQNKVVRSIDAGRIENDRLTIPFDVIGEQNRLLYRIVVFGEEHKGGSEDMFCRHQAKS